MSTIACHSRIPRPASARGAALAALLTVFILAAACGGGSRSTDSAVAGGDAGAMEVDALDYEVTPERYQRWLAAQRALDATTGLPEPPALDPARFTEGDVDRAV